MVHLVGYQSWVDFDLGCVEQPGDDGKLAELAEQMAKMVEHLRPKSTQPNYPTRWTTLYSPSMLNVSLLGESNMFPVTPATCELLGIIPDNYCTAYSADSSSNSYTWKASVVGEVNPVLLGGKESLSLKVRRAPTKMIISF